MLGRQSVAAAAHLSVVEGETVGDVQYDTDRGRFLGRGRTPQAPYAVSEGWPLANTTGAVLRWRSQ